MTQLELLDLDPIEDDSPLTIGYTYPSLTWEQALDALIALGNKS